MHYVKLGFRLLNLDHIAAVEFLSKDPGGGAPLRRYAARAVTPSGVKFEIELGEGEALEAYIAKACGLPEVTAGPPPAQSGS